MIENVLIEPSPSNLVINVGREMSVFKSYYNYSKLQIFDEQANLYQAFMPRPFQCLTTFLIIDNAARTTKCTLDETVEIDIVSMSGVIFDKMRSMICVALTMPRLSCLIKQISRQLKSV